LSSRRDSTPATAQCQGDFTLTVYTVRLGFRDAKATQHSPTCSLWSFGHCWRHRRGTSFAGRRL